ncbi:replicative DNA helicase [Streptomyces luteogriseus]|uniref:Replicative DNA helicase n=1 Tax=Streptomyces luteogriseus TaxID=68233 RepID=A0A7W7DI61_9ACTN|nr:replicative DNA helicase [Streptomyces luteogriseus]MBB4711157.1 replicative DNA helicase [Streptomyces luteogriseus]
MNEETYERPLPHDSAAEQAVLGAMLLSTDAITDVVEILDGASDFHEPHHELVYGAILALYTGGRPVDPITVSNHLREQGVLAKAGGAAAVHNLVNQVPTAAHAQHHAEIVHDCALRRRMILAGTKIVRLGYGGADAAASLDAAQAELNAAAQVREDPDSALIGEDLGEMVSELEALQRDGRAMGVPTGFADLDALTNGLHPGQMVIVAGRPALGKSTLGVDVVRSCSIRHGRPSVFFSLEMSRREVQHRIASAEARIGLHHIRSGTMTDTDWLRLADNSARIAKAPLTIDATPNQTVMQIKARCRQLKHRAGLDLVVIDYLQLLTSGMSRRQENRQQEVSDMSRSIKLMAKELEVPVIVLCQLNRGPEQRSDKKPQVADLRESGSLEQDADMVILLHREDAYEKEGPRAGEADLIVGKHRNGPTATITVAAQLHYSRFVDMALS